MTATELSSYQMFLQNPALYVGKCSNDSGEVWTIVQDKVQLVRITWNSILLKMFDELLMNCLDNYLTSRGKMSYISVRIDGHTITIENDGHAIPIDKVKDISGKSVYNPELIFSRLFTSSHYNRTEIDENIAGQNGIGAKIASIFSRQLVVEIQNNNKLYTQTFTPNEVEIVPSKPAIKKRNGNNYTKIQFEPNVELISKYSDYTEDIYDQTLQMFFKRLIDVKLMEPNIHILLNESEVLREFTIEDLCAMFNKQFVKFSSKNYTGMVAFNTGFKQYSIVNGIYTSRGGDHINKIVSEISGFIESRLRRINLKPLIKSSLLIVFVGRCKKPTFTSQDKVELDKGFQNKLISATDLNRINNELKLETTIVDRERDKATASNSVTAKRLQIKDLTDATYAGTKESSKCVLFLAEGLSALSFAKIGMKTVLDANYFGCYPIGGKPLNVRKATVDRINKNAVISNIEKILGLKTKSDNVNLRYGRVVILKDADTDGAEIMGLIINFFHHQYPNLLHRDFLYEFQTPMIKLYIPNSHLGNYELRHLENVIQFKSYSIVPFYNEQEFNHFKSIYPAISRYKTDYIKGLAGNEDFEVSHYFKQREVNEVQLVPDENLDSTIEVVYGKNTHVRKEWMFNSSEAFLERCQKINISDFLNTDVLMFSLENCKRSIPSAIDGLKPSQRKVLWTLLNKNSDEYQKVFMLTGQIASYAYYNHGDASMNETIIKMGQNYPGSNNVNLIEPSGFFGSREYLGSDHGAPRYIKCRLNKIARKLFPAIDTKLLPKNYEDNVQVEPKYFIPIVPMVLCNGSCGIGTGYSSFVPMYSLEDLKQFTINWINTGTYMDILPKINGFNGSITKTANGFEIKGCWKLLARTTQYEEWEVTEIPYNIAFVTFESVLKDLYNKKQIIMFRYGDRKKNKKGVNSVNYIIRTGLNVHLENLLPLISRISAKNMTLFDSDGNIKKYWYIRDIFEEWAVLRYDAYEARRNYIIAEHTRTLNILQNRLRFLTEMVPIIRKVESDLDLSAMLEEKEFMKIDGNYEYLLNMPMKQLTKKSIDKINADINAVKSELDSIENKTAYDLWLDDLSNI